MDDTTMGSNSNRGQLLLGHARDDERQASRNTNNIVVGAGALTVARDYRRGNWTLPETMLLIEAKRKVHEERHPGDQGLARWRWVEDYCWRAGCRRSQNQCNDRWDNLMRDYKKVRAYELSIGAGAGRAPASSYWALGRPERKDRGLPSNLLREIYDGMGGVIERRMSIGCGGGPGGGGAFTAPVSSSSLLDVVPMQASPLAQVLPRTLLPALEEQETTHGHGAAHYSISSPESPEKKRRRASSVDESLRPGSSSTPSSAPAGTHGGYHHQEQARRHREQEQEDNEDDDDDDESSESDQHSDDDDYGVLSGAIGRCAAILSEALESRDAAEERRHREVMAVEERRGRARQARREAGEQCVAGLAAAVNQLAGSMLALAAAKHKDKDKDKPSNK